MCDDVPVRGGNHATVLAATAGSWQKTMAGTEASMTARALLRILVARLEGSASVDVAITARCELCGSLTHGRPLLTDSRYHVSLAHSGRWVAAVVSNAGPVGIDVERNAATAFPGFAEVALAAGETASSDVARAIVWTRKEAILKATGQGLTISPTHLRVSAACEPARLLSWRGSGRPRGPVRLFDLAVAQDYTGAIAVLSRRPVLVSTLDGDELLRQEAPAILPRTATR
jgi:4'-phosphopantetheinyl transferase